MMQPTTISRLASRALSSHQAPVPRLLASQLTTRPCLTKNTTASTMLLRTSRPIATAAKARCSNTCLFTRSRPSSLFKPTTRRAASTTATPFAGNPSSSGTTDNQNDGPLTWNRFLALRKTRRRISLASSIVCAVFFTATGLSVITAVDLETTAGQSLGLDPIAVLGLSTAGLACAGWLVGPMFGNAVFGVVYRGYRRQIIEKERAFYDRIKKHRVDPSNSSIANPVPDYYGEKIGSVTAYRRWLKDQRAFNLKRGRIS